MAVASSLRRFQVVTCVAFIMVTATSAMMTSSMGRRNFGHPDKGSEEPYRQELKNLADAQYIGVIEVGGQKLNTVVDTGSFELVVFGSNCSVCGSVRNLYDGSQSKGYEKGSFPEEQNYGSGTTYSNDAHDSVAVGDLTVSRQIFWEVYDANMGILQEDSFAAILGVGPPGSALRFAEEDQAAIHKELDEYKQRGEQITDDMLKIVKHYDDAVDHAEKSMTFVDNLDERNMSACMGRQSGSAGWHIWSDDASRLQPEKFETLPVIGDIYWSAAMTQVHTGKGFSPKGATKERKAAADPAQLGCIQQNCSAIIDTGTSLIVAPSDIVQKVHEVVDAWIDAGGTCDDLSKLPDLLFKLDGKDFRLPAESYVGKAIGELASGVKHFFPDFHLKQHLKGGETWGNGCQPLVLSMDADSQFGPLWILGMPFFREYYTTFSFVRKNHKLEAESMSFSIADDDCKPKMSPAEADAKTNTLDQEHANLAPRKAQMNVDLSKVRIPQFAQKVMAQVQALTGKLTRPQLRI